jgi:hypothetical protein
MTQCKHEQIGDTYNDGHYMCTCGIMIPESDFIMLSTQLNDDQTVMKD